SIFLSSVLGSGSLRAIVADRGERCERAGAFLSGRLRRLGLAIGFATTCRSIAENGSMARRPPPGQGVDQEPRIATTRAADGVTIAYASEGHGPALVHLPGLPFSNFAGEWRIPLLRRAFTRLGASLELIQYDGRGTGHSQRDVADLSFEAMLGDLEAVVDAAVGTVGPRRVAMLGFYHSTIHAIAYAARHPERVSHL